MMWLSRRPRHPLIFPSSGAAIQALTARVTEIESRRTAFERRPVVSLDEVLARLDVLERAEYTIETATSLELGHGHDVQATVVRVK